MRWGLVTGASSGIGWAFARHLAARGWSVLLTGRQADRLAELCGRLERQYPDQAFAHRALDLTAPDAVADLYRWSRATAGFVELLVNNAGRGAYGATHGLPGDRIRELIRINVEVPTLLAHRFLADMYAYNRGIVVFVGSVAGFMPTPYSATYGATKAFLGSLALALWHETRSTGIRVHLVAPGLTHTLFHYRALGQDLPRRWLRLAATPDQVVAEALRRMDRHPRRCVIIPGFTNRWLVRILKVLPGTVSTRLTGWVQRWALAQLARAPVTARDDGEGE